MAVPVAVETAGAVSVNERVCESPEPEEVAPLEALSDETDNAVLLAWSEALVVTDDTGVVLWELPDWHVARAMPRAAASLQVAREDQIMMGKGDQGQGKEKEACKKTMMNRIRTVGKDRYIDIYSTRRACQGIFEMTTSRTRVSRMASLGMETMGTAKTRAIPLARYMGVSPPPSPACLLARPLGREGS